MENEANKNQLVADQDMVKKYAEELSEHFDTVQIFVTRHMPAELDGTRSINVGIGNCYARSGQVREWLVERDESCREDVRQERKENQ